jgi:hypothetical protein
MLYAGMQELLQLIHRRTLYVFGILSGIFEQELAAIWCSTSSFPLVQLIHGDQANGTTALEQA